MTTSPAHTPIPPTTLPFAEKHFAEKWTCPCCGEGDELDAGQTDNYGDEVFEGMSCPKCAGKWRNEYRLYCIRRDGTGEAVLNPSAPLAALCALAAESWLDADPCDTDELAAAKKLARSALLNASQPN